MGRNLVSPLSSAMLLSVFKTGRFVFVLGNEIEAIGFWI
jgi:hypothetical protein